MLNNSRTTSAVYETDSNAHAPYGRYLPTIALVVAAALAVLVIVGLIKSRNENIPLLFSERTMLSHIWEGYKREYLEPETYRTPDRQRGDITTSEGQSYTMLRAVWNDDKQTFDRSWAWTKNNLQREDALFSWLFGQREDGS